MITVHEESLHDVLALLGYTTSPGQFASKHIHTSDGEIVFTGNAGDVWSWLRESKQIVVAP